MKCCKDCPMRIVGCHQKCKMYIEEKAKHEEMKKQERQYAESIAVQISRGIRIKEKGNRNARKNK